VLLALAVKLFVRVMVLVLLDVGVMVGLYSQELKKVMHLGRAGGESSTVRLKSEPE
jgi:uncharacterized membrane protein